MTQVPAHTGEPSRQAGMYTACLQPQWASADHCQLPTPHVGSYLLTRPMASSDPDLHSFGLNHQYLHRRLTRSGLFPSTAELGWVRDTCLVLFVGAVGTETWLGKRGLWLQDRGAPQCCCWPCSQSWVETHHRTSGVRAWCLCECVHERVWVCARGCGSV